MYGALRELGRYYARQLGWFFQYLVDERTKDERFVAAVKYQADHSIQKNRVSKGLLGATEKAGEYGSCLGLGLTQ